MNNISAAHAKGSLHHHILVIHGIFHSSGQGKTSWKLSKDTHNWLVILNQKNTNNTINDNNNNR